MKPSTHSGGRSAGCLSVPGCLVFCNNSRSYHKGTIRSCRADNLRHDERRRNLPHYLPISLAQNLAQLLVRWAVQR